MGTESERKVGRKEIAERGRAEKERKWRVLEKESEQNGKPLGGIHTLGRKRVMMMVGKKGIKEK